MLGEWTRGEVKPTLKQLEAFARATHAPVGFLFLSEPPVEKLPIPDFRTLGQGRHLRLSPDLLDTIYLCQQRQEWFHDFARTSGERPLAFVGSASLTSEITATAAAMRHALGFELDARAQVGTWTEALRLFIDQADELGVLVMVNGIVGNNTSRKLDPEEFRGFAISDGLAPLVFVNGADTKAAQMFTLAHELAHLWLGESAVSDAGPDAPPSNKVETWCNRVAAELLVPLASVHAEIRKGEELDAALARLARRFKVSTLVILRRMHDAGAVSRAQFGEAYAAEVKRLLAVERKSGGNFYPTQTMRVGKRFARSLIANTLEGQTLHRDALRLLGISKLSTFQELGHRLGVG
jgi:Zn-dependent peptidase ImmA (M78 family)